MDDNNQPHQMGSNQEFVQTFLLQNIQNLFPQLNKIQVETFILNLYSYSGEWI